VIWIISAGLIDRINLKLNQVFPSFEPRGEQCHILGFHQLKTDILILANPGIKIMQALRQQPALLVEAFEDRLKTPKLKVFNDHVLFHRFLAIDFNL
jgi:hypothetical protein